MKFKLIFASILVLTNTSVMPQLSQARNTPSIGTISEFIPWPTGTLQLEIDSVTEQTSSWCIDDIGARTKYFIVVEIAEKEINGTAVDSKDVSFYIKSKKSSNKKNYLRAWLSEDNKQLYFDGSIQDGSGTTNFQEQILHLTTNLKITGKIQWHWQSDYDDGECTGLNIINGGLNY